MRHHGATCVLIINDDAADVVAYKIVALIREMPRAGSALPGNPATYGGRGALAAPCHVTAKAARLFSQF